MVDAPVFVGALDGDDILHILHHTYGLTVAAAVGADGADVALGDIVAYTAIADAVAEVDDGRSERNCGLRFLAQKMKRKAKSGLATYSGQFRKFGDSCIE